MAELKYDLVTLAGMLPKTARYRVLHHDSKSNMDLQIVDYCNWAVSGSGPLGTNAHTE